MKPKTKLRNPINENTFASKSEHFEFGKWSILFFFKLRMLRRRETFAREPPTSVVRGVITDTEQSYSEILN